ncbi:putative sugar O-methyltransferase [Croceicoccus gelatinilyticus]|uniref:putative sugar O-methyltransferase n=1 Tax=Croceicoccus gelatinilyticus TaxID=2835536 RepID=UPI001BCB2B28|nr:putative sugar O-methyltransferase [Croceicoccus gelatinilyticus]MBS7669438.1 putative sugar O-methyltransferase [Croceicoccus gelatinilyticus]
MEFNQLLTAMVLEMDRAPDIVKPSKFWSDLNEQHGKRLGEGGIENFRRTLAKDYFTWMRVLPWDSQIRFLVKTLGPVTTAKCAAMTFSNPFHDRIPMTESLALNFLTRLLWAYASRSHPELATLSEPQFGNPPDIRASGRLISQDLANSVLEFASYRSAVNGTVYELGGGYGRNAYVTAKLASFERYVFADISPALAVAQEFIRHSFPNDRLFGFRPFDSYSEIADEIENSRFVFLLPHQLEMMPDGDADLFLNISSLHEMRIDQVDYYLAQIRRLVRPNGHFYLKAWESSNNPDKAEQINSTDYDLSGFQQVFWRTPEVQTRFFETLQMRAA